MILPVIPKPLRGVLCDPTSLSNCESLCCPAELSCGEREFEVDGKLSAGGKLEGDSVLAARFLDEDAEFSWAAGLDPEEEATLLAADCVVGREAVRPDERVF